MPETRVANVRPTRIEPPIPQREYEDIRSPESGSRSQQLDWRFFMLGQRANQQHHRSDHSDRYDTGYNESERSIQAAIIFPMGNGRRYQQNDNDYEKQPSRADDQRRRQRCVEASDGENGDKCRPTARFRIVSYLFFC